MYAELVSTGRARSSGRLALLVAALEALDRADQARKELAEAGTLITVTPTTGVVRLNPLVRHGAGSAGRVSQNVADVGAGVRSDDRRRPALNLRIERDRMRDVRTFRERWADEFGGLPTVEGDAGIAAARELLADRSRGREAADAGLKAAREEVERIEAAVADGELDPIGEADRIRKAETAVTDSERASRYGAAGELHARAAVERATAKLAPKSSRLAACRHRAGRPICRGSGRARRGAPRVRAHVGRALDATADPARRAVHGRPGRGSGEARASRGPPDAVYGDLDMWVAKAQRCGVNVSRAVRRPLPAEIEAAERRRVEREAERAAGRAGRWCPARWRFTGRGSASEASGARGGSPRPPIDPSTREDSMFMNSDPEAMALPFAARPPAVVVPVLGESVRRADRARPGAARRGADRGARRADGDPGPHRAASRPGCGRR